MEIYNFVCPDEIIEVLNRPDSDLNVSYVNLVERFYENKGEISREETSLLAKGRISGSLRSLVDDWLFTGLHFDGHGSESPAHDFDTLSWPPVML